MISNSFHHSIIHISFLLKRRRCLKLKVIWNGSSTERASVFPTIPQCNTGQTANVMTGKLHRVLQRPNTDRAIAQTVAITK